MTCSWGHEHAHESDVAACNAFAALPRRPGPGPRYIVENWQGRVRCYYLARAEAESAFDDCPPESAPMLLEILKVKGPA